MVIGVLAKRLGYRNPHGRIDPEFHAAAASQLLLRPAGSDLAAVEV
jgi:hypothetical protein